MKIANKNEKVLILLKNHSKPVKKTMIIYLCVVKLICKDVIVCMKKNYK